MISKVHRQVLPTAFEPHFSSLQMYLSQTHNPLSCCFPVFAFPCIPTPLACPSALLLLWRKLCVFLYSLGTSSLSLLYILYSPGLWQLAIAEGRKILVENDGSKPITHLLSKLWFLQSSNKSLFFSLLSRNSRSQC